MKLKNINSKCYMDGGITMKIIDVPFGTVDWNSVENHADMNGYCKC